MASYDTFGSSPKLDVGINKEENMHIYCDMVAENPEQQNIYSQSGLDTKTY
jgi:hypothetical protein